MVVGEFSTSCIGGNTECVFLREITDDTGNSIFYRQQNISADTNICLFSSEDKRIRYVRSQINPLHKLVGLKRDQSINNDKMTVSLSVDSQVEEK